MRFPSRSAGWLLAVGLLAVGCEKDTGLVKVRGTITFSGGPCPAPGMIIFAPMKAAAGENLRPATASFSTDGEFTATSYHPGDGLLPGTYRIQIQCWKKPPQDFEPGISYLPEGYEPEELVVDSGTRDPIVLSYNVLPKQ